MVNVFSLETRCSPTITNRISGGRFYLLLTHGLLDAIPIDRIKPFEKALYQHLESEHRDLLNEIL